MKKRQKKPDLTLCLQRNQIFSIHIFLYSSCFPAFLIEKYLNINKEKLGKRFFNNSSLANVREKSKKCLKMSGV
jgi:hypothetical protein